MMDDNMLNGDVPMGFGMALAQNMQALEKFGAMSQEEKKRIIEGTKSVGSKQSMKDYVNQIANGGSL